MYCWDSQSSSRCPQSLIRTQRHFPYNSLQNLISSTTLTLCFTEYFKSTFFVVSTVWTFKGEKIIGILIALEKNCYCLCFLLALCWEINFVSQLLCEWGLKSRTSCSLHWFWEKLTQLNFPHNYNKGYTFLLMTRDGIITVDNRGQAASMGVPWEGSYYQPPPSWA